MSQYALLEETEIVKDSTDAISTARVVFFADWYESAKYGTAVYGQSIYAFTPTEWQVLELKDQSGVRQFAGYITQIEREVESLQRTRIICTCSDYGVVLDRKPVDQVYLNYSDKNLILTALAGIPEITVASANIAQLIPNLGDFDATETNGRELLDRICELTGAEWRVDYNGVLKYYAAGSVAAPFALSDTPNNTTSFPHFLNSVQRNFANAANRITVLGGVGGSGAEVVSIKQDAQSQAKYGVLSATVVDRQLTEQTAADLRAGVELAQRAFPTVSGTVTLWKDGLDVGQSLTITNTAHGITGQWLIRTIKIRQLLKEADGIDRAGLVYTQYEVEFGQRQSDLVTQLRRFMLRPRQTTTPVMGIPEPGSVFPGSFASTIEPVRIVGVLPTLPDANYSANAVVLLTTDRKLYRRTGNSWTAVVPATDITGQIAAGQIAADAVTAGTIAAGAIRAVDAAFDAAAIQNADINTLSASKLTAGTIDASVITVVNLNASNITTGSLTADRIGAGTISASVSLTAPTITISSGGTTVNIDATNLVKITTSTRRVYMNASDIGVQNASNLNNYAFMYLGGFQCQHGSSQALALLEANSFGSELRLANSSGTTFISLASSSNPSLAATAGSLRGYITGTVLGLTGKLAIYNN